MSWFVYIAQAKTGRYCTGITKDVNKRIHNHNTHSGSRMGRQQGPFVLVYVSQVFATKSYARQREMQIEGWSRDKKEKLIKGEWV